MISEDNPIPLNQIKQSCVCKAEQIMHCLNKVIIMWVGMQELFGPDRFSSVSSS